VASTRTNLTVAFVTALIAVTAALGLTLWTVRNAALYRDVARYAATQADVAATLVRDAASTTQAVIVGPANSSQAQIVTPRLRTVLDAFPDYMVIVDRIGSPLYQSSALRLLPQGEADSLLAKVSVLPNDSAAIVSLPSIDQLLLFSREIADTTGSIGRAAAAKPREIRRVTSAPRPTVVERMLAAMREGPCTVHWVPCSPHAE